MKSAALRSVALAALFAACAPDSDAPDVVVLAFNDTTRTYEPRKVKLETVTDVVTLEGQVAKITASAEFNLLALNGVCTALELGDTETVRTAITRDEGARVHVSYIERDGELIPSDFHSLNLATTYYNFEQASKFFQRIGGLDPATFGTPEVFYFPKVSFLGGDLTDNAFFFPTINSFMVLPFVAIQQIPLSINIGVIGHEYSHAVFNHQVFNGKGPVAEGTCSGLLFPTPALNLYKALDEGIADVFGTGVSCNADFSACSPNFIAQSLPESLAAPRRIDEVQCMTQSHWTSLQTQDLNRFTGQEGTHYVIGTVFASSMWRAAEDPQVVAKLGVGEARAQMFQTLYRALAGGGTGTGFRELAVGISNSLNQTNFRLDSTDTVKGVLDVVVESATDPDLKHALCATFMDRFGLTHLQLKSCPQTTKAFTECQR